MIYLNSANETCMFYKIFEHTTYCGTFCKMGVKYEKTINRQEELLCIDQANIFSTILNENFGALCNNKVPVILC